MNRDEEAALTAGGSMWTTAALPAAGIPSIRMSDGPMGIASGKVDERDVARLTPCAMALGATFDVDLIARVGQLVGSEAITRDVQLVLAPNINLARSPLAGRSFEYFSEDPLLTGKSGAAWVRGIQATGVGAVPKHLVCNDSETGRDRLNVIVDDATLREVYLLPFELCAEAGAVAMLTAYNRVNGDWCSESRAVMDIVRSWGFDGVLMSDWFGTHSTAGSLNGGLDLEMPGPGRHLGHHALNAVDAGLVAPERVSEAGRRVAELASRLAVTPSTPRMDPDAVLLEAATAAMTMLENRNGILPLKHDVRRIAVIGPNAASPCYQGGTFAKISVHPDTPTPLDAIRARFAEQAEIVYEPGVNAKPRLPDMPTRPLRDAGDGAARGMTLEYFASRDLNGEPISTETRDTNSLVWFAGVHDQGVFDRPAGVRASGSFTPTRSGLHGIHVGGTGELLLKIDGEPRLETTEAPAPGDVMGVLKRGDSHVVQVDLQAGRPVRLEIELRYDGARAQGLWYGVREPGSPEELLERAVAAARAAEVVILVVGETADSSVESRDREDTALPADQLCLIEAVCLANPACVAVVNVGHAFDASWSKLAQAMIVSWYPGEGFGPALASVLAGDQEPGGRLPVTLAENEADYPAFQLTPDPRTGDLIYREGVQVGYRSLASKGVKPLYAFGAGFGFARFKITAAWQDEGAVIVSLTNTSDRIGAEVIQVYRNDGPFALVGFSKIVLAAGTSGQMRIEVEPRLLRAWKNRWCADNGSVPLAVGRASDDIAISVLFDTERARKIIETR